MMGYLNREDKTKEDMDEEGWMHSGDLGTLDSEGFMFITGNASLIYDKSSLFADFTKKLWRAFI